MAEIKRQTLLPQNFEQAKALGGLVAGASTAAPWEIVGGLRYGPPIVAEEWPTVAQAMENARQEALRQGRNDFSLLDVGKHYGLGAVGAVGEGMRRGALQLPGGKEAIGIYDQQAERAARAGVHPLSMLAADVLAPGPDLAAFKILHGSGSMFDVFDFRKIGTGEGSQAFSHGLYFAEAPGTASTYAHLDDDIPFFAGVKADPEIPEHAAGMFADWHNRHNRNMRRRAGEQAQDIKPLTREQLEERAIADLQQARDDLREAEDYYRGTAYHSKELDNLERDVEQAELVLSHIRSGGDIPKPERGVGYVYEVEIDADHHQLLDWDKPLEDHAPETRRRIERVIQEELAKRTDIRPEQAAKYTPNPTMTGEQAYRHLQTIMGGGKPGEVAASAALDAGGVPGTRFLDRQSRFRTRPTKRVLDADGQKWYPDNALQRDVASAAVRAGSLEDYIRHQKGFLKRQKEFEGYQDVGHQALIERHINVAEELVRKGYKVGDAPPTHNVVMYSDRGIKVLSRKVEPHRIMDDY